MDEKTEIKIKLKQYRTITAEYHDILARIETEPEISDILEREEKKIQQLRREVEEIISDIPDSLTRYIIRLRYMDGARWDDIAAKLASEKAGIFTADALRKMSARWLKRH